MFKQILVPIDLDEPSSWSKAVPTAKSMAEALGAQVTLCTVVPDSVAMLTAQWTTISLRALLEEARAKLLLRARELDCQDWHLDVQSGTIAGGILAAAEQIPADLIVLASHRPEMKDWLLGANAARVVRHAKCSVMVVRE